MVNKFKLDTQKSVESKEAISRTLEFANNNAGELSIEVLPLDKVELDPDNKRDMALTLRDAINGIDKDDPDSERKKKEWKSLESLARTIQDGQLINPIYVYRFGNKCRLISGERRTLASAIAGKKEIIARIAGQRPAGTKLRILQWVENNERSDLSLAERVASLDAILQEYFIEHNEVPNKNTITVKLISDLTGISTTHARRYFLIFNTDDEIRKAIDDGILDNINVVEFICSIKDVNQRKEYLKEALSGKPLSVLVKLRKDSEVLDTNKVERRGRKKIRASLGSVKSDVVKIIIDILISSNQFKPEVNQKLNVIYSGVQWENAESVGKAFKKIADLIESGV